MFRAKRWLKDRMRLQQRLFGFAESFKSHEGPSAAGQVDTEVPVPL